MAVVVVLVGVVATAIGLFMSLLVALQIAYPCGETYQVHPSCRLAHPAVVEVASASVSLGPAVCTCVGVVAGVAAIRQQRPATPPLALGLGGALACLLIGGLTLFATVRITVPW